MVFWRWWFFCDDDDDERLFDDLYGVIEDDSSNFWSIIAHARVLLHTVTTVD